MGNNKFDPKINKVTAWCPGCGNFNIVESVKEALEELNLEQQKVVFVSGIGQAAKTPQYIETHYFNGLHGRALPPATAIKASNPELTVIVESGDGDMYGEGGNHFIHTIRRNPDITVLVHNNMVYGLTKGQASPTSRKGYVSTLQIYGVTNEPFNPIAVAVSLGASFVGRAFSGDKAETKGIIKKAIEHKGFSLVDIFQPCISFNKINTFKWFKENTYYLPENYSPYDQAEAFKKAIENEKYPLGVFYINKEKEFTFNDTLFAYKNNSEPLYKRKSDKEKIKRSLELKK